MKRPVTLTVNGTVRTAVVEPRSLLVHVLRDDFNLTGTHIGCDTSQCGACTVLIDGLAVKSCTQLAVQCEGQAITTIEGIGTADSLHPLQAAFWEKHGLQCGFCTPGMILTAVDLLAINPDPAGGDPPRTRGQLLQVHRLPEHRRGGAGRGQDHADRQRVLVPRPSSTSTSQLFPHRRARRRRGLRRSHGHNLRIGHQAAGGSPASAPRARRSSPRSTATAPTTPTAWRR